MVRGTFAKWSADYKVKRTEFPTLMGISLSAFMKRERNPMDIRFKEIFRLWDELGVREEEKEAFWKEITKEWEEMK